MREEGISDRLLWRHPARTIGLYLVHTDGTGERGFTYFRDNSAARECFSQQFPASVDAAVVAADLVHQTTARRHHRAGVGEVVVEQGPGNVVISTRGSA